MQRTTMARKRAGTPRATGTRKAAGKKVAGRKGKTAKAKELCPKARKERVASKAHGKAKTMEKGNERKEEGSQRESPEEI